jgi:hypothetical protein
MRTRIVRRARVVITARTLDHGSMVAEEQRCNSLLGRNVGRGGNCELPSGSGDRVAHGRENIGRKRTPGIRVSLTPSTAVEE